MSETKLYTGTLLSYDNLDEKGVLKFLQNNPDLEINGGEGYNPNEKVQFIYDSDTFEIKYAYVSSNETLYKMTNNVEHEDTEFLDIMYGNEDEINYAALFHNGGTCLSEVLENSIINHLKIQ